MSFDLDGFDKEVNSSEMVSVKISSHHPLIKLAKTLPWQTLLDMVLPDLKHTEKLLWWRGRPLQIRIHLGIYLLQQMFNLTDRQAEYFLKDNAAFQIFCGYGIVPKWHTPDHTKIEEFRSRLLPETQRRLANYITAYAAKLGYANPKHIDIDSTIQEANISYPFKANLLLKVAVMARRISDKLNQFFHRGETVYQVPLKYLKGKLLHYFNLKRQKNQTKHKMNVCTEVLKSLWQDVFKLTMPIFKDCYKLTTISIIPKNWSLRNLLEKFQWHGYRYLESMYQKYFVKAEDQIAIIKDKFYAFHAHAIMAFNKGKLNKNVEYGRAYQLGRIEGNFIFVGECTSLHMPDAQSLPVMIEQHERLFENTDIESVSVDKCYYALSNQKFLEDKNIKEIGLPRPQRKLNAPRNPTSSDVLEKLHNRRAGIEPLIGHIKHGGQMGRSRMKSDHTTLSAGYTAVLGFNLRQLKRALLGKISQKFQENQQNITENGITIPAPT